MIILTMAILIIIMLFTMVRVIDNIINMYYNTMNYNNDETYEYL